MQIIKPLTLSLLTTGLLSAFSVSASETTLLTCNGCSPTKMEAVTQYHLRTHKDEFIVVADYQNETVIKFQVHPVNNKLGKQVNELTPVDLTADESNNIDAIIEARKALAQLLPDVVKVNTKMGAPRRSLLSDSKTSFNFDYQYLYYGSFTQDVNVYDFMQASFLRNNAYQEYFGGNHGTYIFSTLSKALISFRLPYDIYDGIGLHLNIQFKDENQQPLGTAQVAIDPTKETFNVIAATDADNNSIPMASEQLNDQSFVFSSDENKRIFDQYIEKFSTASGTCSSVSKRDFRDISLYTYQCTATSTIDL